MKKLSLLLFAVITAVIFYSCSKEDQASKPISLTAEKSLYAPYEIVTITTSETLFTTKSFAAKINDVEVMAGTDEKSASFVLPNLPNGNYNLSFSLNDKNYIVPITVSSLSNILSADKYFNEIQASINQNINNLNSQITQLELDSSDPNEYENLKNDVIKYNNLLNDYKVSYNNLSDLEKQEFAKTMASNIASVEEYNALASDFDSSNASLRIIQSVQDYEAGVEISKIAYLKSVAWTVGHIPFMIGTAKLIASPNPWVSAGATLATGIIFINYCINLDKTITCTNKLVTKAIKPYENIIQTDDITYDSGVEKDSYNQIKYRSLINSDSNSQGNRVSANNTVGNGSTITTIAQKYNFFKDKYNNFINILPSLFRPSYIMTPLKNTYKTTTRTIHNNYLSITNCSNPKVTIQQLNKPDGSIKIKATTTETSTQVFTYDITYTNNDFTTGLTKTVSAKIVYTPPCGNLKEKDIVGNWTWTLYSDKDCSTAVIENSKNVTQDYELRADKSVWRLGLTPKESESINGDTGWSSWSIDCDGTLSMCNGREYGFYFGKLNSSGNVGACNGAVGGYSKVVKN